MTTSFPASSQVDLYELLKLKRDESAEANTKGLISRARAGFHRQVPLKLAVPWPFCLNPNLNPKPYRIAPPLPASAAELLRVAVDQMAPAELSREPRGLRRVRRASRPSTVDPAAPAPLQAPRPSASRVRWSTRGGGAGRDWFHHGGELYDLCRADWEQQARPHLSRPLGARCPLPRAAGEDAGASHSARPLRRTVGRASSGPGRA